MNLVTRLSGLRHYIEFCVLLAVVVVFSACVTTTQTMLNPLTTVAKIDPSTVQIYLSESELDTLDYVRVAIIEASGSTGWTTQSNMYNAMRKRAASLGCNGVLVPKIQEPGAGAKIAGAFLGTGTERRGEALAIKVLGPKKKQTVAPVQPVQVADTLKTTTP